MNSKIIAIAGSTGFIAGELIKNLKEYEIIRLKRDVFSLNNEQLASKIKDADIIINLAGSPIIKRWTNANKKKIYNSRIITTTKLVNAVSLLGKDIHFINASAIGIYDEQGIHNEESKSFSVGFIYEVINDWEREAMKLPKYINNLTIIRIGIVLSKQTGLLKKIYPIFKAGLGGKIGSGNQWLSFIHIKDLISSIKFIIQTKMVGIVNLTTPDYVTNKEFTKILSDFIKRPAFVPIPVLLLKLLYGEGSRIIYTGQRVLPERLLNSGFKFKYPDIFSALKDLTVH
jgi:uncharacterized protein